MAQLQISELPQGSAADGHEVPTELTGTTYRVGLSSIKDWITQNVRNIYDPGGKASDVYDRANHIGTQALSTVPGAMSKAGDTMTGPLILPSALPTDPNQAVGKAWVEAITGGLGDAPSDNAVYGRMNAAWTKALPLTGGVISGTLDTTGKLTVQGGGLQVTGGLTISSGGMTLNGSANFGANTLTCGGISASGNVSGANLSTGGTITATGGSSSASHYSSSYIQSATGFIVNVSSAQLYLGSTYGWNQIMVTPSNYAIYMGFAGNNMYTFQTDRFAPINNGGPLLGTSTQRWDRVYSINADSVSSDEKLKKDVRPFTEEEVAAARGMFPLLRLFRWKDEAAGTKLHAGVIAQEMEELFAAHGLTITDYAFFEIDDDMQIIYNEDGSSTETPTGTQTRSIVYPELLVWMMAALAPQGA